MDLEKIYHDVDGNKCNILQMVKREPEWAANIIQHYEAANQRLEVEVKRLRDIPQRILAIADRYEKDGEPGPLGLGCWGWRDIASSLRLAVKKALEE